MSTEGGPLFRLLRRFVDIRPEELRGALLACGYFFCLLTSYAILRPLRDEMGVRNQEELKWLFTGTMAGMLLAQPVFAWLVTHWPRRKFLPWVYRFFALNLIGFWALLSFGSPETIKLGTQIFFSWVSVYNLFIISIFWSFMADLVRLEQSRRLFGFLSVGGSIGAIVGASITSFLAKPLGPLQLLLVSAVLLEAAVWMVHALVRNFGINDEIADKRAAENAPTSPRTASTTTRTAASATTAASSIEKTEHGGVFTGMKLVFQSPYLLGICGYMFFYTLLNTFLYFEQSLIVKAAVTESADRTALFARMDLSVNILAAVGQFVLTGRIVKRLGIGLTLLSQPLLATIAFVALGLSPVLGVIVVCQVCLRAANFATAKPAREMLFTVLGREVKYKSKSFIDTFIYRGGDQIGAWAFDFLKRAMEIREISFVAVPLGAVWMGVAYALGRKQRRFEAELEANAAGDVAPAAAIVEP